MAGFRHLQWTWLLPLFSKSFLLLFMKHAQKTTWHWPYQSTPINLLYAYAPSSPARTAPLLQSHKGTATPVISYSQDNKYNIIVSLNHPPTPANTLLPSLHSALYTQTLPNKHTSPSNPPIKTLLPFWDTKVPGAYPLPFSVFTRWQKHN